MKIAIIGCGLIGGKRAEAAKNLGHKIVAVCDQNKKRAESFAERFGGRAYSEVNEVWKSRPEITVVSVTHDQLVPVAMKALKAEQHLMLEKPGARTADELAPLAALAVEKRLSVKVGYNHRFHRSLMNAMELAEIGMLGPLLYVRGRYGHGGRPGYEKEWRLNRKKSGGGELLDQGSHLIDLALWFLGPLTVAGAHLPTYYWSADVEDNAFLLLTGKEGQCAMLHASWTEWKNMFSLEIVGRKGKVVIDGLGGSYGTEQLSFYKMKPEMGPPETVIYQFPFPDRSWEREFEELISAVEMRRQPMGGLDEAMRVLQLIDLLYGRGPN